jgi:hypothetical protein
VQAVDDVDFGERLVGALAQLVPGLLERHGVRIGIARFQSSEGTEETARYADVRGFQADIEVVVGSRAVPFLALAIRQPSERQQVRTLEQTDTIVERQPDARFEFAIDILQPKLC